MCAAECAAACAAVCAAACAATCAAACDAVCAAVCNFCILLNAVVTISHLLLILINCLLSGTKILLRVSKPLKYINCYG